MDLFKNIKSESMETHRGLLTIKIEKDLFIEQEPGEVISGFTFLFFLGFKMKKNYVKIRFSI